MGKEKQKREAAAALSLSALRKIIASKGKLNGIYYYAGDNNGKDVALVVTLAAKDKGGKRASSTGKEIRKMIPKAKFSRGTVNITDGKLVFALKTGSANTGVLKKGFKQLCKSSGMSFLKKAVFQSEDGEVAADTSVSQSISVDDLKMPNVAIQLLKWRMKSDSDISVLLSADGAKRRAAMDKSNREMNTTFLSVEEEQAELNEITVEELRQLEEEMNQLLSELNSENFAAILQSDKGNALAAFAKQNHTGPNPFPNVGESLASDIIPLNKMGVLANGSVLVSKFRLLSNKIILVHDQMIAEPSDREQAEFVRNIFGKVSRVYDALNALTEKLDGLV